MSKRISHILSITAIMGLFASYAAAAIIPAPIDQIFVPHGFDDNDSVEFVVSGYFPNTCYSRNKVETRTRGNTIYVNVSAIHNEVKSPYDLPSCAQMIIPFFEVITVGQLKEGGYNIVVNNKTRHEIKSRINIAQTNSTQIDEHIYAHLSYIEVDERDPRKITLVGMRPSDCIEIDKVVVKSNDKDVLSILPIMKKVKTDCPMKMTPYKIPHTLNFSSVSSSQVLLHARSMEGKSVSTIVRRR